MNYSNNFYVIGLMSGTSLDGVDLCYVHFKFDNSWSFQIHHSITVPYSLKWVKALKTAPCLSGNELHHLDVAYTEYLSQCIQNFIQSRGIVKIDAVCSHGHTVKHQPHLGITKQIGNSDVLANKLGLTVVCNFRPQDVFFGGQGAPLVPIGDKLLFSEYKYCLNLGGFANISFKHQNKRLAFDIVPVNIVLNHYVSAIGLSFDNDGDLAKSGTICRSLFWDLNSLNFYELVPPKSLGLEWVQDHFIKLVDRYDLTLNDVLCTCVEHAAYQISKVIHDYGLSEGLITGGGAYNHFLISRITNLVDSGFLIPTEQIIDFKEALIFGLMGVLKLKGEVNCLASVTGAKFDHSSGEVFLPKNRKYLN